MQIVELRKSRQSASFRSKKEIRMEKASNRLIRDQYKLQILFNSRRQAHGKLPENIEAILLALESSEEEEHQKSSSEEQMEPGCLGFAHYSFDEQSIRKASLSDALALGEDSSILYDTSRS